MAYYQVEKDGEFLLMLLDPDNKSDARLLAFLKDNNYKLREISAHTAQTILFAIDYSETRDQIASRIFAGREIPDR